MSVTLRETLQAALELIQVYGAGERLGQADAARGVAVANSILDEWSLDSLACYAMRELTVPLKTNQSVYRYGPTEDEKLIPLYESPFETVDGTGMFFPDAEFGQFASRDIVMLNIGLIVNSVNKLPEVTSMFRKRVTPLLGLNYAELRVGSKIHLSPINFSSKDSTNQLAIDRRKTLTEDFVLEITGGVSLPKYPYAKPNFLDKGLDSFLFYKYPVRWVSGANSVFKDVWSNAYYCANPNPPKSDYPNRPTGLMGGPNSAYVTDGNGTRYPVQLVDLGTWNQIANTKIIKSNIPTTAYYRANFPVSEVWLYPTPTDETYTFTIQAYNSFDVEKLDDGLDLPPGYAKALLYALGKELWPFYRSGDVPPAVQVGAAESLAAIQRMNKQDLQASYDKQLLRRPNLTYNIYRDNTR